MNAHSFTINTPINPSALLRQQTPLTLANRRIIKETTGNVRAALMQIEMRLYPA